MLVYNPSIVKHSETLSERFILASLTKVNVPSYVKHMLSSVKLKLIVASGIKQ